MSLLASKNCILYQNAAQTITLLDIPRSIGRASGLEQSIVEPLTRPYPSTEPKGKKREKLLSSVLQAELDYHQQLQALIQDAIHHVRVNLDPTEWCHEREPTRGVGEIDPDIPFEIADLKHESLCSESGGTIPEPDCRVFKQLSRSSHAMPLADDDLGMVIMPPLILSSVENRIPSVIYLKDTIVSNPNARVAKVIILDDTFVIPPHSTFLLSNMKHGLHTLTVLAKTLTARSPRINPGKFDFILLDPPWPNRSVRHAQVYDTLEREKHNHPFHQALPVVSQHLAETGIVAIWITNKPIIRGWVLQSMNSLGLELYEEWVWIKTTIKGEPVTALNGLWRKPYEILLLFHHHDQIYDEPHELQAYPDVTRRVIVAVPNVHSQKPCLKELLDPLMPENYRALEVFARNLTVGWWSWGNEVLKFNEVPTDGNWTEWGSICMKTGPRLRTMQVPSIGQRSRMSPTGGTLHEFN